MMTHIRLGFKRGKPIFSVSAVRIMQAMACSTLQLIWLGLLGWGAWRFLGSPFQLKRINALFTMFVRLL